MKIKINENLFLDTMDVGAIKETINPDGRCIMRIYNKHDEVVIAADFESEKLMSIYCNSLRKIICEYNKAETL